MKVKQEERKALLFELRDILRFSKEIMDELEDLTFRDNSPPWDGNIPDYEVEYAMINSIYSNVRLYGSNE